MIAYFSSKLTKQIHAAFTVALLVFCLLGTHWAGLSHSISHGITQSQAIESKTTDHVDKSFSHSSDACHLFDALSLAGFIPYSASNLTPLLSSSLSVRAIIKSIAPKIEIASYRSRAPPKLIL